MKKIIVLMILAIFVLSTPYVFAAKPADKGSQAKTKENIQKQEAAALTQQIKDLKNERKSVLKTFTTKLKVGSRGNEVKNLQTILSLDPSISTDIKADGVLGPKTKQAIAKFQAKYGLTPDGIVGAKTKAALETELQDDDLSIEDGKVCSIIPPGHLIAPGWLRKNGGIAKITPPTCQNLPSGIAKKLSIPVPAIADILAPEISAITSTELTATTAKISWTTNEGTKSKIWYGTETIIEVKTAKFVEDSNILTPHVMTLSGLTPSTVYNFIIEATDAAGNSTLSAQQTFTTIAGVVDTTAPVISGITATSAVNTEANVTWTTDEPATGKVIYSLTDVTDTTTTFVESTSLSTNHTLVLTGLTQNTKYYYKVISADGAGNKSPISTQYSFTTANITPAQ